ncbi:hypothetical protein EWE75_00785 [Sphingomonas populi]|uniref:Uncharacterized protein n=1 Tax=Sphingomonas populi TaxID=2484750 RepID=A0A4Q6Y0R9_9SPHN|nr:hypothetical protein EWE75_00785 [Sphingomonas populi]
MALLSDVLRRRVSRRRDRCGAGDVGEAIAQHHSPSPSPFRRFAPPSLSHWEREGARVRKARGKGEGEL